MLFKRYHTLEGRLEKLERRLEAAELDAATTQSELERVAQGLAEFEREMAGFRLDYEGLYDKARTTLAKLAKRVKASEEGEPDAASDGDPLARFRRLLVERKLRRQ